MNKKNETLIHIAVWTVLLISPQMFMNHGNGISLHQFLFVSIVPLSIMVSFYANYLWLAPRYFATGNKKAFFTINIIMILLLGMAVHVWMDKTHTSFDKRPRPSNNDYMFILMILRNIFNLAVSAAIATTIQLSKRWQASESARREAEAARTNAELKNASFTNQPTLPAQHTQQHLRPNRVCAKQSAGRYPAVERTP